MHTGADQVKGIDLNDPLTQTMTQMWPGLFNMYVFDLFSPINYPTMSWGI